MKRIKSFFSNIRGWMFSIEIIYLSSHNRIASISGFAHWRYAKRYANKRHGIDGKRYYVFPSGLGSLIVFNSLEMKDLKRRGFIKKGVVIDINTLLNTAYYYTPQPAGKAKNNGKV